MSKELETIAAKSWLLSRGMWLEQLSSRVNLGGTANAPTLLELFAEYHAHVLSQQHPSVIDAERTGVGEYVVRFGSQIPAGQVAEARTNEDAGDLTTATMYINTMLAMFDNDGCVYQAQAMDAELKAEIIDWLSKLK
jgi:hypothetical protein